MLSIPYPVRPVNQELPPVILPGYPAVSARVFCTGKTAWSLWKKTCAEKYEERYQLTLECLPSTSPANAACTLEKLIEAYKVIAIG